MSSLDLALVGNCTLGALIDERAEVVWGCLPRFDGDPFFCSLLRERRGDGDIGFFAIDVFDFAHSEQQYLENTAIVVTRLHDQQGGCVEVTDFVPRFPQYGRIFRPMMLVRKLKRLAGSPRITLRLRPAFGYGDQRPAVTWGSNHVRYVTPGLVVRLTTDASITAVLQETTFFLEDGLTFLFGPDETVPDAVDKLGQHFLDETAHYWRQWVSTLGIPFEWQDAVIRAAITLKLNTYEDAGAIIAAMTTSIPEAPNSTRNWDYRYCWLRDGYFVVNALNRLGGTHSMEHYIAYIVNVAAAANGLQPVYGIDGRAHLEEQEVPHLSGYRDMGPVRIGNEAYRQVQHDVYGSVILAAMHLFFDRRLTRQGDATLFHQLEPLGERAVVVYNQPDAGIWEFRGSSRIHTYSAVMCWVACDRLAKVAIHLELHNRGEYWRGQADRLREEILRRAWSEKLGCFSASLDGEAIDASLLLLVEMNFVEADDPRFTATVAVIENELRHGDFIFRYVDKDDFGTPETAFLVCTFWYINALAAIGRRDEARELFTKVLGYRNRHGLLAEDVDIHSGEQWGNFVQTYSMAGLINAAIRLSIRWDQAF